MELEGLKRAIGFLQQKVNIQQLVTDRHPSVKCYMKKEQPKIEHLFDVWHVAKG